MPDRYLGRNFHYIFKDTGPELVIEIGSIELVEIIVTDVQLQIPGRYV